MEQHTIVTAHAVEEITSELVNLNTTMIWNSCGDYMISHLQTFFRGATCQRTTHFKIQWRVARTRITVVGIFSDIIWEICIFIASFKSSYSYKSKRDFCSTLHWKYRMDFDRVSVSSIIIVWLLASKYILSS